MPAVTPVTTPVDEPTVAIASLLLNHVPPDVVFESVAVDPTHAFIVPVVAAGLGFTVIVSFREQPVASV